MTTKQIVSILDYLKKDDPPRCEDGGRYIEHVMRKCHLLTIEMKKVTGMGRTSNWRYMKEGVPVPREAMLSTFRYHLAHVRVGDPLWWIMQSDSAMLHEAMENGDIVVDLDRKDPIVDFDDEQFSLPRDVLVPMIAHVTIKKNGRIRL